MMRAAPPTTGRIRRPFSALSIEPLNDAQAGRGDCRRPVSPFSALSIEPLNDAMAEMFFRNRVGLFQCSLY